MLRLSNEGSDMFNIFTDAIEAGLSVASDTFDVMIGEGEGPTRRNVAQLLDAGLTVAAIAQGFGVAESVIEELAE